MLSTSQFKVYGRFDQMILKTMNFTIITVRCPKIPLFSLNMTYSFLNVSHRPV